MKKMLWLVVLSVILVAGRARALPNPAALYAKQLGYEYKVVSTPEGEKDVVVVEPGVEFDAWDFYRGKVGSQYAYGDFYGYDTICVTENKGSFTVERAVCVSRGGNGIKKGERIALEDLMARNHEPLLDRDEWIRWPSGNAETGRMDVYGDLPANRDLPISFDWRDRNGVSYIGPVRNQGDCGSCYSFAACAAAEGTYNVAVGLTDDNCVDFSESFIAWCLGSIAPYSDHFYGCGGADYDYYELAALCDIGIISESVFPYVESDPGSCDSYMDASKVRFANWNRVACNDINSIKTAIMTYGVVDAAVLAGQSAFETYSGGIYSDDLTSCDGSPCYYTVTDHAISLVGWNDEGGYWILRNSWGANWGENGYMRVSYHSARVACEVSYLTYTAQPLDKQPVYRFYSTGAPESTYSHFWTMNETEKNVLNTWPSWKYEDISWYAYPFYTDGSVPLYRLYASSIGRHLYTTNTDEYTFLDNNGTWVGEGVQYYVMPSAVAGVLPAYRFYNETNRSHHYTISENEKSEIIANPQWGYSYEGVGFYVYPSN